MAEIVVRRGWWRKGLIGFAAVTGLMVAIVVTAWLWINSLAGRDWVAARLSSLASSPGQTITVTGIGNGLPFHIAVDRIAVADAAGAWLTVSDTTADLDWGALWRGTARIDQLSAREIEVLRLPVAVPAAASKPVPGSGAFLLPHLPVAVELGRLAVPRIVLAAGLAGEAMTLGARGAGTLHAGAGAVTFGLDRLDGTTGSLALRASYGPQPAGGVEILDLTLKVTEPTGALMEKLLAADHPLPLSIDLGGKGPLAQWTGRLDARVGPDATLGADLAIARHPMEISLGVTGVAKAAALLPDRLKPAVGDSAAFDIAATIADAGPIGLDHAQITMAAAQISAAGRYDPAGNRVTARLDGKADLAPLSAAAGQALTGAAEFVVDLSGTTMRPVVTATIDGSGLGAADQSIEALSARLSAVTGVEGRIRVTGEGHLAGLRSNGAAPPAGLGDALDWTADLDTDRAAEVVEVTRITTKGAGFDLDAAGNLDHGRITGHATLAARDLSRFARLAGTALGGDADLALDAESPDGQAVEVKLSGHTSGFRLGIPAADAALGPQLALDAAASRDAAGKFALAGLHLAGTDARIEASGSYDPQTASLLGHAALSVPRLDPVGSALGTPLTGNFSLTADATGLPGKAESKLHLAAAVVSETVASHLGAILSRPAPNRLAIDDLTFDGPGTSGKGAVLVDLTTHQASGSLSATASDLAGWSPLLGRRLSGSGALAVKLTQAGGQGADLGLDLKDLAYGSGSEAIGVKRLHVAAQLADLLRQPRGSADLDLAALTAPGARIDTATLRIRPARGTSLGIALTGGGQAAGKPVSVDLAGSVDLAAAAQSLTLARLDGRYGPLTARLLQPLAVSHDRARLAFNGLSLDLAGGRIAGNGSYDPGRIDLRLVATTLPLGTLAQLSGRYEVAGALGFDLAISGPPADPRGRLVVTGDGVKLAALDHPDLPALSVVASADLVAGGLDFKGRIDGGHHAAALGFSGTAPLAFAADGIPTLRPDGALAGRLEGEGRLETLSEVLPLGEDKLAGRYTIGLTLGGTVAAPEGGGHLTLDQGSYDSGLTGMTLRGLSFDLAGDGRSFVMRRLQAGDGGSGRLEASGRVDLAGPAGPVLDFRNRLTGFTVARRDELTAVMSGTAEVTGRLLQPAVTAALTIDRASANIPQQLPPTIVRLNVVRIDSADPAAAERARLKAAAAAAAPVFQASLDVTLHDAGQTFVRGDGLDSEWKGDLHIHGTTAAPAIAGEFDAVNGTFSVLGKTFTIQRGVISFPGSAVPQLDILAQAQTASITAQVLLTGPPDQPKLTLSSVPALPQDEILSQVMFGTGAGQITPAQGLQIASAAATLAGGGPGVLDRLRDYTGLDRLSVGDNTTNATTAQSSTSSGSMVSGGKYVAPGIFVGVDQGVSGGTSTRAKVEITLTPHITVDATAGAGDASSSLGVQYKLDY
jgi:translocation and assembly module TamB